MASGTVTFSRDDLSKTAHKYRKEFLMMPVHGLGTSLQHMSLRPGIRYAETVGEMVGDMQFGPYSETRKDNTDVVVNPRTLYTYFGSVVKNFSPNKIYQSIWGSNITKGEGLKSTEITRQVVAFLCARLGFNLNRVLWTAVRNDSGEKSEDLFNGFDVITKKELDAKSLDVSKGNYKVIEAISELNAVETLRSFYWSADDELQGVPSKLFIPTHVYQNYLVDYQTTVGPIPYNKEFQKTFLEGSNNLCELVPLSNKKNSPFMHLTTQKNMLVGVNQSGEEERIEIERFEAFVLQFIATMFFGVEFESINKERMLVGGIDGITAI